jgi:peptidoglycan/LPS O-acetylase OafA/YrhL
MVADHSHECRLSGGVSASNRRLPSLTSLRGIAALWVVLYHYCGTAQYFPNLDITPHSYLISKGYLAVDMFFMLSGLVMTHVYYRSQSIGRHYRGFLAARVARLYPLHIFILLLFVVTAARHHQDIRKQDRRIETETANRLQRNFRRAFGIKTQVEKTCGLLAQSPVLGEISAGLPHQPEWRNSGSRS